MLNTIIHGAPTDLPPLFLELSDQEQTLAEERDLFLSSWGADDAADGERTGPSSAELRSEMGARRQATERAGKPACFSTCAICSNVSCKVDGLKAFASGKITCWACSCVRYCVAKALPLANASGTLSADRIKGLIAFIITN